MIRKSTNCDGTEMTELAENTLDGKMYEDR